LRTERADSFEPLQLPPTFPLRFLQG